MDDRFTPPPVENARGLNAAEATEFPTQMEGESDENFLKRVILFKKIMEARQARNSDFQEAIHPGIRLKKQYPELYKKYLESDEGMKANQDFDQLGRENAE